MTTDFTRFDFHVVRFLSSETVKRMTAEEVGQFILLLCEAWVIGKEATLPDDPAYLTRIARCNKVSPLVMSKFPKIEMECGMRRQNEALYKEWQAAVKRSTAAKERGRLGNEARWGNRGGDPAGDAYSKKTFSPIPYQAKPIRSEPDQTSQEIIEATIAASNEEIARDTAEHLKKKADEARLSALSKGVIG